MCNLYRQRSAPQSIMDLAHAMRSDVVNLPPRDICPPVPEVSANYSRWAGDGALILNNRCMLWRAGWTRWTGSASVAWKRVDARRCD